jgi:hypothetical protein
MPKNTKQHNEPNKNDITEEKDLPPYFVNAALQPNNKKKKIG